MADILIRGMEMPKNCLYCHFVSYDNDRCVVIDKDIPIYGTKPSWCPLVPLPEGHGRLIDADTLIENHFSDEHRIALSPANKLWMRRIIKGEPTIIEAEGGTDDDG